MDWSGRWDWYNWCSEERTCMCVCCGVLSSLHVEGKCSDDVLGWRLSVAKSPGRLPRLPCASSAMHRKRLFPTAGSAGSCEA